MLFFLLWSVAGIIVVILLILLLVYFLEIKIETENFKIDYVGKNNERIVKYNYIISGYEFGKVRIFKIKLNDYKIKQILKHQKVNAFYRKFLKNKTLDIVSLKSATQFLKKYRSKYNRKVLKVKKFDLELKIGIINMEITTGIVVLLSTFLSIIYAMNEASNWKYRIEQEYDSSKIIQVNLIFNSIIIINLKHIINMLLKFKLWRVKEYDTKSSNRRINEYCHE